LLLSGNAFAQTSTDVSASQSSELHQTIDIPRDNVLAALALGAHPDIWEIANFDRSFVFEREFDRDVDIDEDDALLWLALDRNGGSGLRRALILDSVFDDDFGFGGFGFGFHDDLGFADVSESRRQSRNVEQTVDIDRDDVLSALALGGHFDLWDIADVDRSSSASTDVSRDIDLDDEDLLLWLALT